MYTCVRLAHIVLLYIIYSLVTNQMACTLVNNSSLVICKFNTIFFVYNYCNATLRCCAATYYAALSFTLYNNIMFPTLS